MSEKEWEKARFKESSASRDVPLHYYRFAKFLRYLKKHKATITLDAENSSYRNTYSALSKDGNPSLEQLLMDALIISESNAREYTSRKLKLNTMHSSKDRLLGMGNVIEAITFYLNSDGPVDQIGKRLTKDNAFSVRNTQYLSIRPKDRYAIASSMIRKQTWTHFFSGIYKNVPHFVLLEMQIYFSFVENMKELCKSTFPFFAQIQQLGTYYGDALHNALEGGEQEKSQDKEVNQFFSILNKVAEYYEEYMSQDEVPASILPGYWDFLYPYNKQLSIELAEQKFENPSALLELDETSMEEFINYRYEILWMLDDQNLEVEEWEVRHKVLLFWTMLEYEMTHKLITYCLHHLFTDLRFIIYTSNDNQVPDFQQDSLTIDELCHILSAYNFKDGLRNTVQVSGINLIKGKLLKFPEHHAAKGSPGVKEIYPVIYEELKRYFYTWISDDLNIPPQFRYRYTEN